MFSEIEREYKKGLQQKRFIAYYWPCATIVVILAVIFALVFNSARWVVYGCAVVLFCVLVIVFFAWDLHRAGKVFEKVRDSRGLFAKLDAYFVADDKHRLNNLLLDLAEHDIRTKADLELTMDYFKSRLPSDAKPNLLEWVLTAVITLSSIVVVAYDDSIGTISLHRLIPVFGSALVIALIILTPFIMAKLISVSISISRNKVDTALVEDLAYIYVHFERYRARLAERPTQAELAAAQNPD